MITYHTMAMPSTENDFIDANTEVQRYEYVSCIM